MINSLTPTPRPGLSAGHTYCRYFSDAEIMKVTHPDFVSSWSPAELIAMLYSPTLLDRIDAFREKLGRPVYLTSGYRGPVYNKSVGGRKNSSHLQGFAFDFKVPAGVPEFRVYYALSAVGFKRVGVGRTFYHADVDPTKKPAFWRYNY